MSFLNDLVHWPTFWIVIVAVSLVALLEIWARWDAGR